MKYLTHSLLTMLAFFIFIGCTSLKTETKSPSKTRVKPDHISERPKIFWFGGYGSSSIISSHPPGEGHIICNSNVIAHVIKWTPKKIGNEMRYFPNIPENAEKLSFSDNCFVLPISVTQKMKIQHFTETQNDESACAEVIKSRITNYFHKKIKKCVVIARANSIEFANVVFEPEVDSSILERYFVTVENKSMGSFEYNHLTPADVDDRVATEAEEKAEVENDNLRGDGSILIALANKSNTIDYIVTTDQGIECGNIRLRARQKDLWVEIASDSICAR